MSVARWPKRSKRPLGRGECGVCRGRAPTVLVLPHGAALPTSASMAKRSLYQRLRSTAQVRLALFVLGVLLILISPIVGVLPGPGFLILFPLGLMLCLQNSAWAKRIYVRFKRRHPRYAAWTDRVMRRTSAARRREREALAAAARETPEIRANAD